jgi:hypothetical protein
MTGTRAAWVIRRWVRENDVIIVLIVLFLIVVWLIASG